MEIDTLFRRALQMSVNVLGYHVTRELADQFPDREILFGTEYVFELEEYIQSMELPCEPDPRVFRHITTDWEGHGLGATRETASGWYRLQWEGHALEVGLLSSSDQRFHWILAPKRDIAEKFLCAVCDWSVEVRGEVLVFESGVWAKNEELYNNELDGFATNTGVVVIATTNHPERLDPAILERPSRFDRKYTFTLPAPEERAAYIAQWNSTVEPDLRLSNYGLQEVIALTNGFSFAYMKELFLSAMMRWIAAPRSGGMDNAMLSQIGLLREQMRLQPLPIPEISAEQRDESATRFSESEREEEDEE